MDDEADEAAATTVQKIVRGHQARRELPSSPSSRSGGVRSRSGGGRELPSSPSLEGDYQGEGSDEEDGEGYGEADVLYDDQYGSEEETEEERQLATTEQWAAMKLQSVARGRNVRRDLSAADGNQCDESTLDPNRVQRAQSHAVAHVRATPLHVRATPLPHGRCGRTTPASLAPQSTRVTATSLIAAQPRETIHTDGSQPRETAALSTARAPPRSAGMHATAARSVARPMARVTIATPEATPATPASFTPASFLLSARTRNDLSAQAAAAVEAAKKEARKEAREEALAEARAHYGWELAAARAEASEAAAEAASLTERLAARKAAADHSHSHSHSRPYGATHAASVLSAREPGPAASLAERLAARQATTLGGREADILGHGASSERATRIATRSELGACVPREMRHRPIGGPTPTASTASAAASAVASAVASTASAARPADRLSACRFEVGGACHGALSACRFEEVGQPYSGGRGGSSAHSAEPSPSCVPPSPAAGPSTLPPGVNGVAPPRVAGPPALPPGGHSIHTPSPAEPPTPGGSSPLPLEMGPLQVAVAQHRANSLFERRKYWYKPVALVGGACYSIAEGEAVIFVMGKRMLTHNDGQTRRARNKPGYLVYDCASRAMQAALHKPKGKLAASTKAVLRVTASRSCAPEGARWPTRGGVWAFEVIVPVAIAIEQQAWMDDEVR